VFFGSTPTHVAVDLSGAALKEVFIKTENMSLGAAL